MWYLSHIIVEVLIYFVVDNITKLIVVRNKQRNRFDILIGECVILGVLVGFISYYYYLPWILVVFLSIHVMGTIQTEKGFTRLAHLFSRMMRNLFLLLNFCLSNISCLFRPSRKSDSKPIPAGYLYNYHLKPTNDLRLQQSTHNQLLPRPGIINVHGTTCSLNSLVQSLASLDRFYSAFKGNINLSRFNYDPIVSTFLNVLSQLRNDHRISTNQQRNTLVDTSELITQLNTIYPKLLSRTTTTDICELFQSLIDALNQALSKQQQSLTYSKNVIEQVQNSKLTTFSIEQLNQLFTVVEAQFHDKITLDNLDAQTSSVIQYVDLTWLLHHIQQGSIIKHVFSGQFLHAHCCENCSHVRFRTEPFQILSLTIPKTSQTLGSLISQLTNVEIINSMACSSCSNPSAETTNPHGHLLKNIASTLSPIVTNRRQLSDQILSSTPITGSTNLLPSIRSKSIQYRMKSQTMLGNCPEILCIQLKRFSYDRLSQQTRKINTSISIEPEKVLDLSSIHYATWLNLNTASISYQYRLIAVCLHLSEKSSTMETSRGHCVSIYRSENHRWFLSDDERITEINHVDHFFQSSYVTENSYFLFYERC